MEKPQETRVISHEELRRMTPAQFNDVLLKAVKIEAKVLVRDKDGNPKYDNPSLAGSYGEPISGESQ